MIEGSGRGRWRRRKGSSEGGRGGGIRGRGLRRYPGSGEKLLLRELLLLLLLLLRRENGGGGRGGNSGRSCHHLLLMLLLLLIKTGERMRSRCVGGIGWVLRRVSRRWVMMVVRVLVRRRMMRRMVMMRMSRMIIRVRGKRVLFHLESVQRSGRKVLSGGKDASSWITGVLHIGRRRY